MQQEWQFHVPYKKQLESDTCVPTCLGMMMEYYGVTNNQSAIDEVARTFGNGICGNHRATLRTARAFGFDNAKMAYFKGARKSIEPILFNLLAKQPIMVTGKFQHFKASSDSDGHAILLIGSSSRTECLIYHDPHHRKAATGVGEARRLAFHEFFDLWSAQHHGWALWLQNNMML